MQLNDFQTGQPIYTKDVAEKMALLFGMPLNKAVAATGVAFKRIMDKTIINNLRFYQKGIYYLTAYTPFGEVGINKECLIADKYLLPDIGYETGLSALYKIGLTTQLPNERCFVTNKAKNCVRTDEKLGVLIRPPKTTINEQNKMYLQLLDVLEFMDKAPVDVEQPYTVLANYIQRVKLEYKTLLSFADKYYNKKTVLQIAHIASSV
ncbi:MAG: hypothetical protein IJZ16_12960 [Clostridia bacterium]|nr:hypothetical protein [Clostridia bacterium]